MKSRLSKEGFTLIELMVVIILVLILALALVPTFQEIITKAKYTEGSSAISALRTKIKVAWLEDSMLPGLPSWFTSGVTNVGGMSWGDNAVQGSDLSVLRPGAGESQVESPVQAMYSRERETKWLVQWQDKSAPIAYNTAATVVSNANASPWQGDLEIQIGDYAGAYFKNSDYQYVAINGGKKLPSYAYAIAVTGSGNRKSPPVGTGYAVMEIYNPDWTDDKRVVATYSRYKSEGDDAGQMYLNVEDLGIAQAITIHSNSIPVPNWYTITSAGVGDGLTTNVSGRTSLNAQRLENVYGFSAQ